ncbi:MAG: AAA family ATPase [Candidatus Cryptobacteroides sp.]
MLYPIGIQNFEDLRRNGFLYVDKTPHIYRLASTGKYYFLSRPRRFGKSLLISTMDAYFSGKKELFRGLAMEQLEKDWIEYPVLHLDLNGKKYDCLQALTDNINYHFALWDKSLDADTGSVNDIEIRFKKIIDIAYEKTGKKVVILIDEYDKPIVDNLFNSELADNFKKTLQGFYSVLKAKDGQIKFGFLTGVSKIGKLSVFSALNNLKDISMVKDYADICGISEKELYDNFDECVSELGAANNLSKDESYLKLKEMYDGYHFTPNSDGVYNPFSMTRSKTASSISSIRTMFRLIRQMIPQRLLFLPEH